MTSISPTRVPDEWLCPITYEIMQDPVIAPDGRTYERANIEEWLRIHGSSPFTREDMTINRLIPNMILRDIIQGSSVVNVQTDITPENTRKIYCLIDRSGSMGCRIETKGYETDGFNRLDLVKHAVRTIIHSLTTDYSLGIVTFSANARTDLRPVRMDGIGKARSIQVLEAIHQDSTTNIWDGIREIMSFHSKGDQPIIILLTDGVANVHPPRGELETLRRHIVSTGVQPVIHTIGFGYDIDSLMLHQIASETGGLFGFIPDCTMIGTVFVNILTHILTGESGREYPSWPQLVSYLEGFTTGSYTYKGEESESRGVGELIDRLLVEYDHTDLLTRVIEDISDTSDDKGQISKAVSCKKWFDKWGIHYLRSLHLAHKNCICLNFKDQSLQDYKTDSFTSIQEKIEDIFINLPAPVPSDIHVREAISSGRMPATPMSVYYSASSGCFTGDTMIRMSKYGSALYQLEDDRPLYQPINTVCPGDWVISTNGMPVQIRYVIVFKNRTSGIVKLSDSLAITDYHPVRRYMGTGDWTPSWEFPCDIAPSTTTQCDLYNLVLTSGGGTVFTPSHECVVFGHGITDDEIVSHEYFGSQKIVDDIQLEVGASSGFVDVITLHEVRDSMTGKVVRYLFNQD